jgi:2',3'-cyclic-nucleotide 2'-phosphodiesterase (5'-nucleotidase family)
MGNALNSFQGNIIVENLVKSLPNGLMVGILGWMGIQADAYAPAAKPVTFNHTVSNLQDKVDALKSVGCDIIVLLSHGGVEEDGEGDDRVLANAITGLDIIASGHAHTAMHDVVEVNDTLILLKYIQAWSAFFPLEDDLSVLPTDVPYNESYLSTFSRVSEQ